MNTFFKGRRGLILNWWKFFKGSSGLELDEQLMNRFVDVVDPKGPLGLDP